MGEPAFLSEEFSNTVDPDLELVTTSGYGKNGALSVLQVKNILITWLILQNG
jgi:cleavage and polyadenylation specificity factor subunit 1